MTNFTYSSVTEDEAPALATMLSDALHFNQNREQVGEWLQRVGHEAFRVVRDGTAMASGLGMVEAAQWFGGRKVPIIAITPLGASPVYRGRGSSSFLLQKMHEEARERGLALSCLYPATLSFYRRSGYEKGGAWNTYELNADSIHVKCRDLDIVPAMDEEGEREIRAAYQARARINNGHLERWPNLWKRNLVGKEKTVHRYLVQRDGRTEGYVCYAQGGQMEQTRVVDWCALTRDAAKRLLTFFADDRSMTSSIVFRGGPNDAFLFVLSEPKEKVTSTFDWVVRITDVEKALTLRGYPASLSADIHLGIRDDQLNWNDGRFILRITEGRAEVRRGGDGRLTMDVQTLATLYTGYLTPREMMLLGGITGDDRDLSMLELAFSGPRPWMPDIF